ncbi:MAG: FtsH protease activity modulator HflK [Hydrogenovibrio sp.]|uniref:FtsH protease activity modulator HflK n=1 Tax=Hydrogenovibrio sp. TaxID=2065821 RepID=UPI00287052E3|nr:FtsH protease activity modulator HflK [Hydrogenovibrio sp.]MDR9497554.1 FtsH protease activity modulator HflK [Hydrogenovibrio sp.]
MAWNEPGKPGQDPWGNPNGSGNGNRPNGPNRPDNDSDPVEKIKQVLESFNSGGGGQFSPKMIVLGVLVVVVIWLLSGLYTVDSPQRGVVKQFGAYKEQTMPGLHWHLPWPIETVTIVNVDRIRTVEIGYRSDAANRNGTVPSEALMLTKDENIVDIRIAVQYRVADAQKYLYMVSDPDSSLKDMVESALREVVGRNNMDFVLTEGRNEVVSRVQSLAQEKLDDYQAGLMITSLNLQDAQPPEQVQDAFSDVVKAREDRERLINEAETYANGILPEARGQAARLLEESRAYYDRVIAEATGKASRFASVQTEYQKAPVVTRQRLYIDAIADVLGQTSKVFVGAESGTNLLYLPLDKMMGNQASVPFRSPQGGDQSRNQNDSGRSNGGNQDQSRNNSSQRSNIRDILRTRELR